MPQENVQDRTQRTDVINKLKIVLIDKLMWHKRNETLQYLLSTSVCITPPIHVLFSHNSKSCCVYVLTQTVAIAMLLQNCKTQTPHSSVL